MQTSPSDFICSGSRARVGASQQQRSFLVNIDSAAPSSQPLGGARPRQQLCSHLLRRGGEHLTMRSSPYEGCQACGRVRYFFVVRFSYAGGSLRRQILAALLLSGRGLVKVERSRARGRVASNTLIRPRPDIHFSPRLPPPGRAVKSFFLSRFFLRARFAPQGGSFLCRARCLSRSPAPIRASHRASPSCRA